MDRADILSGAAFRAVLRSAMGFVLILAVMSALALRLIDDALTREIRLAVGETETSLSEIYRDDGAEALLHQVESLGRARAGQPGHAGFVHAVFDAGGTRLAGPPGLPPAPAGWERRALPAPDGTKGDAPKVLLHARPLGDWTLVTAASLSSLRAAQVSALRGLAVTGFLVVLAMLAVGYVLSRASLRKLRRIEATLDLVSQGDVSARIAAEDDMSQIARISQRIDAHLARLETLMGATRRTAASVAHDLRKPLARARLTLDRALARAEAGQDARAEIEATAAQLDALTGIIATILRIARIEAGETGDTEASFDLAALLDELFETYEPVAEDAGQTLRLALPARPLALRGDRDMIAQMVVNLLQNALTHAGTGAAITLAASLDDDRAVTLSVADTGPGIPAGDLDAVFEPFFRSDTARTLEGSGLGLALVKAIATRHGAAITLSDTAPGLAVRVRFATPSPPGRARPFERP
ncbi:MAG: HAMP domain-containing sensor histidine kinase [Paracoccaceae bacterium]